MLEALVHRGPDGAGLVVSGGAVLGHRRLAIHDLTAAGCQPFLDPQTGVTGVVNGEFYDADDLRARLSARGHRFRGRSDSELLIPLWLEHGTLLVHEIHGPFALAVFDPRSQELFLARDRLGKKPLFVAEHEGGLAFASELRALRVAVPAPWRAEAVPTLLRLGWIPAPQTPFEGIQSLLPGEALLCTPSGTVRRRWWEPAPTVRTDWTPRSAADALERELGAAVRRRMRSDRPLGVLLSGGLDSAAVAAVARDTGGPELRGFTLAFDDAAMDESRLAELTASSIDLRHDVVPFTSDPAALLRELIETSGEMLADASWIALAHLCRAVSGDVTVVLTGDGGDETLLGYRRHRAARWASVVPSALRPLARQARRLSRSREWQRRWTTGCGDPRETWSELTGLVPWRALAPWLHPDLAMKGDPAAAALPPWKAGADPAEAAGLSDLTSYLPGDLLPKADRAGMAFGLEMRAPFLDDRVVDLGLSMPGRIRASWTRGKLPLRAMLGRRLPDPITSGRKRGFQVPLARWLTAGSLRQVVRDCLGDSASPLRDLLRTGAAEALAASLDSPDPPTDLLFGCAVVGLHRAAFGHG